jgi:hypothetical protein
MSTSTDHVAGQVFTAANADNFAQGVLGINAGGTSDVGPTSGSTTLDVATASAVTIAATGRRLRITGTWRGITGSNSGDVFAMRLQEGSTVLTESNQIIVTASVGHNGGTIDAYVDSPSAASHTYKMTITRLTGTGTATVQAAATYPIRVTVEDVGTT